MPGQRIDKWLWCARLVKTRAGAARLIAAGKVRVNGTRVLKPSRPVQSGDVVTAAHLGRVSVLRVIGSSERRGPASLAQSLYEDLSPSQTRSELPETAVKGPRPTKRDRRRLDAFRGEES